MSNEQRLIEALEGLVSLIQSEFTIPARVSMPELLVAEALLEELELA